MSDVQPGMSGTAGEFANLYRRGLLERLRTAEQFVRQHEEHPQQIRAHLRSLLTLAGHAGWEPEASALWTSLTDRLHPYPLLWGYADAWENHLRAALTAWDNRQPDFLAARLQSYLVETLYFSHKPQEALDLAGQALSSARLGRNLVALARVAQLVARIDYDRSEVDASNRTLADAETQIKSLCTDADSALEQIALAILWMQKAEIMRFLGDVRGALELYGQVVGVLVDFPGEDILSRPQFWLLAGEALESRGVLLWARGEYARASHDLDQASGLYQRLADRLRQASVLANLGLVYWKTCQFDRAEAFQLQSIAIREEQNAQDSLARVMGDLGMVYFLRGKLDQAVHYVEVQGELARQFGDERAARLAHANLCGMRVFQGRGDQVVAEMERLLAGSRQRSIEHELGVMLDLMPCYWFLGRTGEAVQAARRIVAIAEELKEGLPGVMVPALRGLALTQPVDEARLTLVKALELAREYEREFDRAACLLSLAGLSAGDEAQELWCEGLARMKEMGSLPWVEGRTPADPPFLPLVV